MGFSVSAKLLFIFGTARSGTSALCELLNQDPRICLGMERYSAISRTSRFTPALFEESRFFDVQAGDTWYSALDQFSENYTRLRPKYAHAEYRGDKIPNLVRRLDYLLEAFPSAQFLITVRDVFEVAASYEARADEGIVWPANRRTMDAIKDWNLMLVNSLRHVRNPRIQWIMYEEFFSHPAGLERLFAFLGMTQSPEVRAGLAQMIEKGRKLQAHRMTQHGEMEHALINRHARFDLYDRLCSHVREMNEGQAATRGSRLRTFFGNRLAQAQALKTRGFKTRVHVF